MGWPQTNFADEKCRMWLKILAFSADFAVRFCVRNQECTISFCGCTIWKVNYILYGRVLLTSVSCVKIENSSFLPFKCLHLHQGRFQSVGCTFPAHGALRPYITQPFAAVCSSAGQKRYSCGRKNQEKPYFCLLQRGCFSLCCGHRRNMWCGCAGLNILYTAPCGGQCRGFSPTDKPLPCMAWGYLCHSFVVAENNNYFFKTFLYRSNVAFATSFQLYLLSINSSAPFLISLTISSSSHIDCSFSARSSTLLFLKCIALLSVTSVFSGISEHKTALP